MAGRDWIATLVFTLIAYRNPTVINRMEMIDRSGHHMVARRPINTSLINDSDTYRLVYFRLVPKENINAEPSQRSPLCSHNITVLPTSPAVGSHSHP